MKISEIRYTDYFAKAFRKLPKEVKLKALTKEQIFKNDCFDKRLKTHKLSGEFQNYYAFSIDYSYRIIFGFLASDKVIFVNVGTHSIYK